MATIKETTKPVPRTFSIELTHNEYRSILWALNYVGASTQVNDYDAKCARELAEQIKILT